MIIARCKGVSGDVAAKSAEALLFTPSTVMPSLFFRASRVSRNMPNTPIEPVRVILSATIASAGQEM